MHLFASLPPPLLLLARVCGGRKLGMENGKQSKMWGWGMLEEFEERYLKGLRKIEQRKVKCVRNIGIGRRKKDIQERSLKKR